MHTYIYLYREVCLSSRGVLSGVFCPGVFCLDGFVWGGFCPSNLLSEYIRYNRKLNITLNLRFHMHAKNLKSVTPHALRLFLCHKLSYLLGPPPPSRATYFMDSPYNVQEKVRNVREELIYRRTLNIREEQICGRTAEMLWRGKRFKFSGMENNKLQLNKIADDNGSCFWRHWT